MTYRNVRWLGIGVFLTLVVRGSAEPPPAPDAAALVRSVREQEAWIDRVESLWLKALVTWEETPRGIAKRRRESGNAGSSDLEHSRIQRSEVAFDRTRIRTSDLWPWGTDDLCIWDGKRFILRNFYEKNPEQDGYLIAGDPARRLDDVTMNFCCFRARPHQWWWMPPERRKNVVHFAGKPEDFAYAGRDSFDGTECEVVCRWGAWDRLYISVADGRLRGLKVGAQSRGDFVAKILECLRREGHNFRDEKEWGLWYKELSSEDRKLIDLKLSANMLTLTEPIFEFGLADYREVAPGCLLPMTQTVVMRFIDVDGTNAIDLKKEIKIIKAQVNKPLPDTLFAVELKDGAWVTDQTHNPTLRYRHKVHFTPEEWKTIVDEAEERSRNAQTRKRN